MHMCVCVCPYMRCSGFVHENEPVRVFFWSFSACSVCYFVCSFVRRQISKNARWEVSPYFSSSGW